MERLYIAIDLEKNDNLFVSKDVDYLRQKAILFLTKHYKISEDDANNRLEIKDIILI